MASVHVFESGRFPCMNFALVIRTISSKNSERNSEYSLKATGGGL
jgi:hypothetical protein